MKIRGMYVRIIFTLIHAYSLAYTKAQQSITIPGVPSMDMKQAYKKRHQECLSLKREVNKEVDVIRKGSDPKKIAYLK